LAVDDVPFNQAPALNPTSRLTLQYITAASPGRAIETLRPTILTRGNQKIPPNGHRQSSSISFTPVQSSGNGVNSISFNPSRSWHGMSIMIMEAHRSPMTTWLMMRQMMIRKVVLGEVVSAQCPFSPLRLHGLQQKRGPRAK